MTYTGNNNQSVITITDDLFANGVTNPMSLTNPPPGWGIFSMAMTEKTAIEAATFPNGDSAIVVGANRKTIINGFLTDTPTSASDGVALFENEITTILPLTVTSANGAERVPTGGTYDLTWIPGTALYFNVYFSTNKGLTWKLLARQFGNVYEWSVPLQKNNMTNCLIRVTGYGPNGEMVSQDKSDRVFTIEVVKLISPNGGEVLTSTTSKPIIWTTNATIDSLKDVQLFYTLNGGKTWILFNTLIGNPGTYLWTVPSVTAPKTKCKVKVVLRNSTGATIGSDISDAFFTIQP